MTTRPSPAKPWEQGSTSTPNSASPSSNQNPISSLSRNSSQMSPVTSESAVSNISSSSHDSRRTASTVGTMGSGHQYARNTYGNSMYGNSVYGNSTYGNAYGGGYGMSRYGRYGSGYGMNSYGGYGTGNYGMSGYGMNGYGGYGMNGYGMGPGAPMGPMGNFGWLAQFNQVVASIGQITELLGMNAETLSFCFGSFVNLMERMGFMLGEVVNMLSPTPKFPPGHPRHGENQLSEEEEKRRRSRVRIVRFLFSVLVLYVLRKGFMRLHRMWKGSTSTQISRPSMKYIDNRRLESIFQSDSAAISSVSSDVNDRVLSHAASAVFQE